MQKAVSLFVTGLSPRAVVFALWLTMILMGAQGAGCEADLDSLIVEAKGEIQEALETWDMARMQRARNLLERLLGAGEKEWLVRYYLGYADYRLSAMEDKTEVAQRYLEDGISQVKGSLELKDDFAESRALLSSLYGMEIGFKPYLAMTNGIRAGKEIGRAHTLDPDNPRVYLVDAIGTLYRPRMFGGGTKNAFEKLAKAVVCYEKEGGPVEAEGRTSPERDLLPSWGREEGHVWIGEAYSKMGDKEKARESYRQALKVNPDYGWAKELLEQMETSPTPQKDAS